MLVLELTTTEGNSAEGHYNPENTAPPDLPVVEREDERREKSVERQRRVSAVRFRRSDSDTCPKHGAIFGPPLYDGVSSFLSLNFFT